MDTPLPHTSSTDWPGGRPLPHPVQLTAPNSLWKKMVSETKHCTQFIASFPSSPSPLKFIKSIAYICEYCLTMTSHYIQFYVSFHRIVEAYLQMTSTPSLQLEMLHSSAARPAVRKQPLEDQDYMTRPPMISNYSLYLQVCQRRA